MFCTVARRPPQHWLCWLQFVRAHLWTHGALREREKRTQPGKGELIAFWAYSTCTGNQFSERVTAVFLSWCNNYYLKYSLWIRILIVKVGVYIRLLISGNKTWFILNFAVLWEPHGNDAHCFFTIVGAGHPPKTKIKFSQITVGLVPSTVLRPIHYKFQSNTLRGRLYPGRELVTRAPVKPWNWQFLFL
jgi:hypothetical protein